MGLSIRPANLKRYKDILRLLIKHGRGDLLKHAGLEDVLDEDVHAPEEVDGAEQLASDLEKMGPTFIKLGQLLSTRADLLPLPYMHALSRLQDKVEPFPYEEVEVIIATQLGLRISKAFSDFDPVPLAAASLAQVHRGVMRDGREVAVKIQRPGIREIIMDDLQMLEEITQMLDKHTEVGRQFEFQKMLEEFRKSLLRELDYRQEAENLNLLKQNLREFRKLLIPEPIEGFTTSTVLTMEFVRGRKITSLGPLARIDLKGADLAEELFHAYLKQILVDGFFHADPHPGNIYVTFDGEKLAVLDLGMVARISPRIQTNLLQLVLAVSEGRGDDAADISLRIGEIRGDFNEIDFRRRIADLVMQNQDRRVEQIQVGRIVLELSRIAASSGIRLPQELTMLGKTLLNLDEVGRSLDPKFNPNSSIREKAADILRESMRKTLSLGGIFSSAIELRDFLEKLPSRVNRILDSAANNQLRLRVDAIDETELISGLQKIANRITMGLILAALIIGAAMMMRVETDFRILGYPGFAILFFLVAALGGILLIFNILSHDKKTK